MTRRLDDLPAIADLDPVYVSKGDMVAATLRELIVTGAIPPGTQLRQREIASQFGVSPTPVREAIKRLETLGLVVGDPHKGATVIEGGFGATEDNYRIRAVLEGFAAELAAERVTEEALDEIRDLAARYAALPADTREARHAANQAFHFRIYSASGSPLLVSLIRLLWQAFPEGPQLLRPHAESIRQHAAIADTLQSKDPQRASEATQQHILGVVQYLPERDGRQRGGQPLQELDA